MSVTRIQVEIHQADDKKYTRKDGVSLQQTSVQLSITQNFALLWKKEKESKFWNT